jgi:hypothetical protein
MRLAPDGRFLYIGRNEEVSWLVVDLTNPSAPTIVSSNILNAIVWGFDFHDTTAFLAADGPGVLAYDVSIPAEPRLLRSYKTPGPARDVKVFDDKLYVAAGGGGFMVLALSDIEVPEVFITTPMHTNTTGTLSLGGAAYDNAIITRVTWSNDRGGGGEVGGSLESWFVGGVTLQPGTNILTVTAFDAAGNSGSDALTVIYRTPKQDQTITFAALVSRTFGDAAVPLAAAASSGLPVGFSVVSGPAALSDNVLSLTGAGNVTVRATQPGDDQFNAAPSVDRTFTVAKTEQAIAFPVVADKSAGDPPFALIATASSGLPVYFDLVSGPAVLDTNAVTLLGGGRVTVRAWQPGNSNYNAAATVQRSFTVARLPQFITFGAFSRQVFGDAPFALSASASSGLPVSFSVLSGPAVMSGNIITMTGAGLVVVRASQSGDATNAPAPNVDQVLVIAPGNNLITDFQQLANGMFTFRFYGEIGTNYVVQVSTNLVNWAALATNQLSGLGSLEFVDTYSATFQQRFYRIAPFPAVSPSHSQE